LSAVSRHSNLVKVVLKFCESKCLINLKYKIGNNLKHF
jgi:hypothetical protein